MAPPLGYFADVLRMVIAKRMPQFMDFHEELKLPFEVIQQITQEANDGVTDEFGVRQVELYYTTESGQV
jgi:hypothetical protein